MPAPCVGRHFDIRRQRRAADAAQVDVHRLVLDRAEHLRDAFGGRELRRMALAVVDAERVAGETLFARERERHGGIHAAGDEHDGSLHGHVDHVPGVSPHSALCSCSWKRTGSWSARIHSASSRGASFA